MGALDNMSATIRSFPDTCEDGISELVVEAPRVLSSSTVVLMAYGLFVDETVDQLSNLRSVHKTR